MGDRTNFEVCVSNAFGDLTQAVLEMIGETADYEPGPYDGCMTFGFEQRKDVEDIQTALEERLIPYDLTDGGYYDRPSEVTHCRYEMQGGIEPPVVKKSSYYPSNDGPTLTTLERMVGNDGDGSAITRVLAYINKTRASMTPEPPIALTQPNERHETLMGELRNASLIAAARRDRTGETTKTLIDHRLILDQQLYGDIGDEVGDDEDAVAPHYLRVTDHHAKVDIWIDGPTDDRVLEASVRIVGHEPVLELDRDGWPYGLTIRMRQGWLIIDRKSPDDRDLGVPPRPLAHLQLGG